MAITSQIYNLHITSLILVQVKSVISDSPFVGECKHILTDLSNFTTSSLQCRSLTKSTDGVKQKTKVKHNKNMLQLSNVLCSIAFKWNDYCQCFQCMLQGYYHTVEWFFKLNLGPNSDILFAEAPQQAQRLGVWQQKQKAQQQNIWASPRQPQ